MAHWNLAQGGTRWAPSTAASGALNATSVVASSTPHEKGAWVEVLAATETAVDGFALLSQYSAASTVNTSTLLDIGLGSAGAETIALQNFQVGSRSGVEAEYIPLTLAGGARVSARCQSAVASKAITLSLVPIYGHPMSGPSAYGSAASYGHDLATSSGTLVTSGANDEGAWVEMTSSTTRPTRALMLGFSTSDASPSRTSIAYDIGVGAVGQETVIVQDVTIGSTSSESWYHVFLLPQVLTVDIPEGSRLSVRSRSAAASSLYVQLYAFF